MKIDISPNFTVGDIHKIRKANYMVTRRMSLDEKVAYYNSGAQDIEERIEELRRERASGDGGGAAAPPALA